MENVLTHAEREEIARQEAAKEQAHQEEEQQAKFEAEAAAQKAKYRRMAVYGLYGCGGLLLIVGAVALIRRIKFRWEDEDEL